MEFEIGLIRAVAFAAGAIAVAAPALSWIVWRSEPRLFGTSRLAVLCLGAALLLIATGFSVSPDSVGDSVAAAGFLVLVLGAWLDWRFRKETAG